MPEYYLGLKLYKNGDYEEVFNGPGKIIRYRNRKGIGRDQLSFPNRQLRMLSKDVDEKERILRRAG